MEAVIVVLLTMVKLDDGMMSSPTSIRSMPAKKAVPEIVMVFPPAAVPEVGETVVTVGFNAKLKLDTELSMKLT
jgi:hypothetical protein